MKISGRTIKQRLYGLGHLPQRLSRARHFRGHGVHSPFVYAIVRQVFMRKHPFDDPTGGIGEKYAVLSAAGLPRKRAVQLANLCAHCGYATLVCGEPREGDMIVAPQSVGESELGEYVRVAHDCHATLAIMAPALNRRRERICRQIVEEHTGTTVDNRGYLLIFNNHLPKQHFKL